MPHLGAAVRAARVDLGKASVDLTNDLEPVLLRFVSGDERRQTNRHEVVGDELAREIHWCAVAANAKSRDNLILARECPGERVPDGIVTHLDRRRWLWNGGSWSRWVGRIMHFVRRRGLRGQYYL